MNRLILVESLRQPLLLAIEDLHWMDPESQAALDALVESLPAARILFVVNYRPEYRHDWSGKTYYTQVRIDPLLPDDAEALLRSLLGSDASLAPITRRLLEQAGGNPFFLEESVHALVETQALVGQRGAYRLKRTLDTIDVPPSIHAVLAARIERLPSDAKALLRRAAAIGTRVPARLLEAVGEGPAATLARGLASLKAAEFIFESRVIPDVEYTFKHALTHDVAYGSVPLDERRALHAGIVVAIEALYPDRLAEHVERLAHHAVRGALWEPAVVYSRDAGIRAASRSAHREAVTFSSRRWRP